MLVNGDLIPGFEALQEKDLSRAIKLLLPLAEQGDPHAQFLLAGCCRGGPDREPDPAEEARWLRRAAEQAHAGAQRELAELLKKGTPGPAQLAEAATWFQKAADQGDSFAMQALSDLFLHGNGVGKSLSAASRWLKMAAEAGNVFAQKELAGRLARGFGVRKNLAAAYAWYAIAQAIPAGWVAKSGLDPQEITQADEKAARWRKRHAFPRGQQLFVEVFFSLKFFAKKTLDENQTTVFAAPCPLMDDQVLGFQYAVPAVKSARYMLWKSWSAYRASLEADPNLDQVFFVKREYWTDQQADRRFVTGFIRNFGDGSGVPSEF
jgi:hypothetical protein